MQNFGKIIRRLDDDSYVITKEDMPYHVYPYHPRYAQLWDEINAYAEAHPEMVREEEPYVLPVPTLEETKAAKLMEINGAADKAIAALTATYPDREIATFDKQEAEARAYTTDSKAPTPLLSALSKARGVPLDELARRVLVKAEAFAVASGSIIGQRQALEDRLGSYTTVEEVEALAIVITMPGVKEGA